VLAALFSVFGNGESGAVGGALAVTIVVLAVTAVVAVATQRVVRKHSARGISLLTLRECETKNVRM
jgi:hypothetical protein